MEAESDAAGCLPGDSFVTAKNTVTESGGETKWNSLMGGVYLLRGEQTSKKMHVVWKHPVDPKHLGINENTQFYWSNFTIRSHN